MKETTTCCANWRSPRTILAFSAMILLSAIIIVSILREKLVNEQQWQINVAGQGRAAYEPDIANINLEVTVNKSAKPEDALNQLNEKMKNVIGAVEKIGIVKENIQTQNYTLNPHYETVDNNSKITGYDANQSIIVKVKEINKNQNKVAEVIATAGKAGANKINGINFEASNFNELKQAARLKAIADARGKAKATGDSLGVKLGKVVGWWENYVMDNGAGYYDGKGGMGMGGGNITEPYIPTGQREIIIDVNLTYKIK